MAMAVLNMSNHIILYQFNIYLAFFRKTQYYDANSPFELPFP
jgi:hypothetical protein